MALNNIAAAILRQQCAAPASRQAERVPRAGRPADGRAEQELPGKTKIRITRVVKAARSPNTRSCARHRRSGRCRRGLLHFRARCRQGDTESLNDTIYDLLIKIYPNKSVEDFEIQRKAATVKFVGTGLSVDIVPVIEDSESPRLWLAVRHPGWFEDRDLRALPDQVRPGPEGSGQGISARLVRMAKKWRNHAELKPLKSFAIELIMAHVLAHRAAGGAIEKRFREFPALHRPVGPQGRISFPENSAPFRHLHRSGGDSRSGLQPEQRRQPDFRGRAKEIVAAAKRPGRRQISHRPKTTTRSGRKSSGLASRRRSER